MSKAYELGKQAYIVEDRIQRIDEMLEKMQSDFVDPETGELSEEAYMEMMDAATSRLSSEYELENLINEIGKEICNLEYLCKESDDIISVQKYNINIKKVLRECGVTRTVSVLDPLTRQEKRVKICDVASSHLARRTFVNNIYRQVKDPALVSALTGHVEGSRAFSRYRDISEDVKRELVEMLE